VATPFWLDEPSRAVDSGTQDEVDVAVIGAGITGVSCALALARGGLRVRVTWPARGAASPAAVVSISEPWVRAVIAAGRSR